VPRVAGTLFMTPTRRGRSAWFTPVGDCGRAKKPNIRTLASGCGRLRSMNTLSARTSVIVLGAGALFLATASEAQMPLAPVKSEIAFTQVAQGCGPGRWRGPGGVCRGSGDRRCKPGYDWDAKGRPCPG
jgi:hypothetical protein